ncbi:MAG: type II toxin-antitoxin system RelE/ParE family toxin [Desulfomicrobium sp.]|nr:type II toxin-antitoxin system RelE/ParE family toxin [Desulfomicrobium sp.]MBV1719556.1 type II toxin-antitoxin system RelE/ParE family toxin [Desulfomicrobium sp.]MBV1748291.1 type II toxin-antitoxin system RelE/ParE family toxin [Desulfomicrobium sp.]
MTWVDAMQVFILDSAEQDLKELHAYILGRFSPGRWRATYGHIKEAIVMLASHPLAGSMLEELMDFGASQYRQIICDKNRIIYEMRDQTIYIHIIVDTRKDLQSHLSTRLLRPGSLSR